MALEENKYGKLVELNDSDYEIVDGEPDIEGWDVKDDQGNIIGEVDDLLFDPESRKVRYMIVELDEDFDKDEEFESANAVEAVDEDGDEYIDDYRVLIPIGLAELVTDDKEVILPGISVTQLSALPLYEKDKLTPETEKSIRDIFDGSAAQTTALIPYSATEFYAHEHFNDDKFYNRKQLTSDIIPAAYNDATEPGTKTNLEASEGTGDFGTLHNPEAKNINFDKGSV